MSAFRPKVRSSFLKAQRSSQKENGTSSKSQRHHPMTRSQKGRVLQAKSNLSNNIFSGMGLSGGPTPRKRSCPSDNAPCSTAKKKRLTG